MSAVYFREATKQDIKALVSLAHELNLYHGFETAPSEDKLLSDWNRFRAYVLTRDEGAIIGFVAGYPTYQFHDAVSGFEIQNLFISEKSRRKGVGKKILYETVKSEYEAGARTFTIVVLKTNTIAKAFYEACGFTMKDMGTIYLGKLTGESLKGFLLNKSPYASK